jgi:tRNA threonylcarbamoyladenosine biosynthesis protein TsaE
MNHFTYRAKSLTETDRLAAALAEALPDGAVVALSGTLGAGKTRLVRGLAAACGVPADEVVSPTFILCQEYRGQRTLYHFDAYRPAG